MNIVGDIDRDVKNKQGCIRLRRMHPYTQPYHDHLPI